MINYFSETKTNGFHAGSKARNDVEIILSKRGYKSLFPYKDGNLIKHFISLSSALKHIMKKDYIIAQYPLIPGYNPFIPYISKRSNLILIIHDIESLRNQNDKIKDIIRIKNAKYIISHNKYMSEYLINKGINSNKIINLNLFDYLSDDSLSIDHFKDESLICFSGNLKKSEFIYNLNEKILKFGFNVYGINFDKDKGKNLSYMGSFSPDEIIYKMKGKFGLVWDGKSTETCSGNLGNYMRYNNPHKLSMYIAACMPVIVWKESAISDFINKNNIGISINNLNEIEKIADISQDEYEKYRLNVIKIRDKISSGIYLNNALDKIERKIEDRF